MSDHSLSPPTVTDAEKPLRRQVAMAYRTAREAMRSHEDAIDAAEAVYFKAHPEALADRLAASARVNELIASAINAASSVVLEGRMSAPDIRLIDQT